MSIDSIKKGLNERKEVLSIQQGFFGEEEGKFLADMLLKEENRHVCNVVFSYVSIDAKAALCLEEQLANNARLKSFSWRNRFIDRDILKVLMKGVVRSTSIEAAELSFAGIGEEDADVLLELVRESKSLRKLIVQGNDLPNSVADVLQTALEQKRLTKLNLGWNNVSEEGTMKMCVALKSNNNVCLRTICLNACRFSKEGATLLAEC